MVVLKRRTALFAVLAVIAAACGAGTNPLGTEAPPTRATTSTTTLEPTTTTLPPAELVTSCGPAQFPLGTTGPVGDPVDEEAQQAFDQAGEAVVEEWFVEGSGFGGVWDWVVVERGPGEMVFVGEGPLGYAYAVIEREGDVWQASGWGGCHLETEATRAGYSTGHWVLDPDVAPDPALTTLAVWVMERSCANGEPPVGRDIVPLVESTADSLTITVIVEEIEGGATCPGNPWYPTTFDLGEPVGDRLLIDGRVRPGLVRPWPPTATSLDSMGDVE